MHDAVNLTRANFFRKFCATNATDTSFPAKIPTVTTPTGGGVFNFITGRNAGPNGILIPSSILVKPYAVGSNNGTCKIRIIGWRSIYDATTTNTTLWDPTPLCEFTCTLTSTGPGVANSPVVATELFADTLTPASWNPAGGVEAVSPAADIPAHFIVDIKGHPIIEAIFDRNSSATSCNALWAGV